MYARRLTLPPAGTRSFFLWGPRQVGKTTLLHQTYPQARFVDLLKADEFRRYAVRPETLRQEILAERSDPPRQIVVDEVLKVPALLDEAHWMIENLGVQFALAASSARKVRRRAAGLLGGRALRFELRGLTSAELGADFDLRRALNYGFLPSVLLDEAPGERVESYVADYLKEEIAAEGAVRSLPAFSDFLEAAALADTEMVSFTNVAQDCGVSAHTAKAYYGILEDTLIGRFLPSYRKRPKRRTIRAPKFYFADVGIVNRLARRGELAPGSELFGKAFENWVFHELEAWLTYERSSERLSYWRLAGGTEVDFIVGDMRAAIEAKAASRIGSRHLRGLRSLVRDHAGVERRIAVTLEDRPLRTEDGIDVLPATEFAERLWSGALLG